MTDTTTRRRPAQASGTFPIGGQLPVHRMGYGAMRLTGEGIWGEPDDRSAAKAVLRRAVDLGVTLIDTADSYGPHVSEELIAEALYPYPEGLVVATKAGLTRPGPGEWRPNGRPGHLREACEGSLRRLRVDAIDLYQLHRIDPQVPWEEQIGVLTELRDEGKVRFLGLSEVTVEQLAQVRTMTPVATVQNRYNLTDRAWEPVLDACASQGIGFLPWFPLAVGQLARPGGELDRVAEALDATTGQVALAWLLRRSPVLLPIPGTSSIAHLEENVAASLLQLSDEQYDELDRLGRAAGDGEAAG